MRVNIAMTACSQTERANAFLHSHGCTSAACLASDMHVCLRSMKRFQARLYPFAKHVGKRGRTNRRGLSACRSTNATSKNRSAPRRLAVSAANLQADIVTQAIRNPCRTPNAGYGDFASGNVGVRCAHRQPTGCRQTVRMIFLCKSLRNKMDKVELRTPNKITRNCHSCTVIPRIVTTRNLNCLRRH
jgi:hypothetical protein